MKNAKTVNKLLAQILDKTDLNPEIEGIVAQLRDEISARDTAMKQAFVSWDEETEEDFTPELISNGDGEDYRTRYEQLKQQYCERFFGGDDGKPNTRQQEPDSSLFEPEPKAISDLFE